MDNDFTDAEQAEARHLLETDNEGAGFDTHTRSYFGFVANPATGVHPVRSAARGIVGYRCDETTADIDRFTSKEQEHLALAASADSPEMTGAHEVIAQKYRLARLTREVDVAYDAQTFLVAAVGWENLMDTRPELARAYIGKSSGMYPYERTHRDAREVDTAAVWLLDVAEKNRAKRLLIKSTIEDARTMSDADLSAAITASKDVEGDSTVFLTLVRERDARGTASRASITKAGKAAASDVPWTVVEERLMTATAKQTSAMSADQLEKILADHGPSKNGRTRMDQLKHETVVREMARRSGE